MARIVAIAVAVLRWALLKLDPTAFDARLVEVPVYIDVLQPTPVEVPVEVVREIHTRVPVKVPVETQVPYPVARAEKFGISNKVMAAAEEGIVWAEETFPPKSGASGEMRCHQVYARLIKAFPSVKRSDLRLAIEFAIRARKVKKV